MNAIMNPNKFLRIFLSFFVLLFSFLVTTLKTSKIAHAEDWVTHGPEGGAVIHIAVSPNFANDQTVFAGVGDHGVFKSSDSGNSWTQVTIPNRVTFVTPSPNYANDHMVFSGDGFGGFRRSTDSGQTWETLDSHGASAMNVAFSPIFAADQTMFFISPGALSKSTDSGATWSPLIAVPTRGDAGLFLSPSYPEDQTIFAGGQGGTYKSTDDGQTWTQIYGDSTGFAISPNFANDNLLLLANGGNLLKSIDEGATWTDAGAGDVRKIAFSPEYAIDSTIYTGGYTGRVQKSVDGGAHWSTLNTGFHISYPTASGISSISLSPDYDTDQRVYVSTGMGILVSSDGGTSWSINNTGIYHVEWNRSLAVSPDYNNDHTIFDAGTGIYKSIDNGQSWQFVSQGLSGQHFSHIGISPNYTVDKTLMVQSYCGLGPAYKTTDGGLTWQPMSLPCSDQSYNPHGVVFSPSYGTDEIVFISTFDGIYKTTDSGSTWQKASIGITNPNILSYNYGVAVSPDFGTDHTVFMVASKLYKSVDNGNSWTLVSGLPDDLQLVSVSPNFSTDDTVLVSGFSSMRKSTDGGNTWNTINRPANDVVSLVFSPSYALDQSIYAVASSGVYISEDQGSTWSLFRNHPPHAPTSVAIGIKGTYKDVFIGIRENSVWQKTFSQPNTPPTVDAGGPYGGDEGAAIPMSDATVSDPDPSDTLTYSWDVDSILCSFDDGSSLNPSLTCTDNGTFTATLTVNDGNNPSVTNDASVVVGNVAPTASFANTSGAVIQGESATLAFSNQFDPSTADTAAGFEYSYDCTDDGTLEASDVSAASFSCPYSTSGNFTARGLIKDKDGGFTSYTVGVIVLTPQEATEEVIDNLQEIVNANPGTPLADKVEDAITKLQTALDELNKTPPDNQAAMGSLEAAVGELEAAVNNGLLDPTRGTQLMDQIAAIARQLAVNAIDQAIAQGGDPQKISEAQQALADGDTLRSSGAFKDAVNKYKDALAKAESALP